MMRCSPLHAMVALSKQKYVKPDCAGIAGSLIQKESLPQGRELGMFVLLSHKARPCYSLAGALQ